MLHVLSKIITLKSIIPENKTKIILANIKSLDDKLKDIKERIKDDTVTYNEINCVLANLRGKHQKKSIMYFIDWYKRTNCFRKCYYNKSQRQECRVKFQQLVAKGAELRFTKNEFLDFFNTHVKICVLPEQDKKRFVSWREFRQNLRKSNHKNNQPSKVSLLK